MWRWSLIPLQIRERGLTSTYNHNNRAIQQSWCTQRLHFAGSYCWLVHFSNEAFNISTVWNIFHLRFFGSNATPSLTRLEAKKHVVKLNIKDLITINMLQHNWQKKSKRRKECIFFALMHQSSLWEKISTNNFCQWCHCSSFIRQHHLEVLLKHNQRKVQKSNTEFQRRGDLWVVFKAKVCVELHT